MENMEETKSNAASQLGKLSHERYRELHGEAAYSEKQSQAVKRRWEKYRARKKARKLPQEGTQE